MLQLFRLHFLFWLIAATHDALRSVILHIVKEKLGSGGIRTHALEETGALNQRLRPLGHSTTSVFYW